MAGALAAALTSMVGNLTTGKEKFAEHEVEVQDILSIGNQTGEGWFLTAEMIEYIEHGISNVVCVQPFACLPNHIVGKGVIKTIREKFPEANIVPIDYDPGASETNQTNRIKLLTTVIPICFIMVLLVVV